MNGIEIENNDQFLTYLNINAEHDANNVIVPGEGSLLCDHESSSLFHHPSNAAQIMAEDEDVDFDNKPARPRRHECSGGKTVPHTAKRTKITDDAYAVSLPAVEDDSDAEEGGEIATQIITPAKPSELFPHNDDEEDMEIDLNMPPPSSFDANVVATTNSASFPREKEIIIIDDDESAVEACHEEDEEEEPQLVSSNDPRVEIIHQPVHTHGIIRADRNGNSHTQFVTAMVVGLDTQQSGCLLRLVAQTEDGRFLELKGTDDFKKTVEGVNTIYKWTKLAIDTTEDYDNCRLKFTLVGPNDRVLHEVTSEPFNVIMNDRYMAKLMRPSPRIVKIRKVIPEYLPPLGDSIFAAVNGSTYIIQLLVNGEMSKFSMIGDGGISFRLSPNVDRSRPVTITVISGSTSSPGREEYVLRPPPVAPPMTKRASSKRRNRRVSVDKCSSSSSSESDFEPELEDWVSEAKITKTDSVTPHAEEGLFEKDGVNVFV